VTDLSGDIALLEQRRHHDPHRILGFHADGTGGTLRVWRPRAEEVSCRTADGRLVSIPRQASALFVATLDAAPAEIVTRYPDGEHRGADPYLFPPTLGELDLHLIGEGRHHRLWRVLGARCRTIDGIDGVAFAVWAPSALGVSVTGNWNGWDDETHPMRSLGASGVWELFIPGVGAGAEYKFAVHGADGVIRSKADPLARRSEVPPLTASIVDDSAFAWTDEAWMAERASRRPWDESLSVYEVHLGSWRRNPDEGGRSLTYREHVAELVEYVRHMGFTHIEFLPVTEHPFGGSWGYQCTGYFGPTGRYGDPDEFRTLIDACHAAGIGVILDWVPAHFPRDDFALARFDGTALYEHADPRRGSHPDWGTLIFNYGRNEVRNFLIASALYWLREMHVDGLRVDAVASMLYLDYSREEGDWVPNAEGGREDLEAIDFLRTLNEVTHSDAPGVIMCAEESTAWPGVSRPTSSGGLGFDFKWNMGWMHDTLRYMARDPIYRVHHHDDLTFGLVYAFSEQFILPLSHDEVVHGKGSLLSRMPGDRWQQLANLRALYGWMWAHPGKKLLFMGGEMAQPGEWDHGTSLPWHLLQYTEHGGIQRLVRDLNTVYRGTPSLWLRDAAPDGFSWIEGADAEANVFAFTRMGGDTPDLVCVANMSPVVRDGYRLGLPCEGRWREVINTDSSLYGGGNVGNRGRVTTEPVEWNGHAHSVALTLPPLGVLWLTPEIPPAA